MTDLLMLARLALFLVYLDERVGRVVRAGAKIGAPVSIVFGYNKAHDYLWSRMSFYDDGKECSFVVRESAEIERQLAQAYLNDLRERFA